MVFDIKKLFKSLLLQKLSHPPAFLFEESLLVYYCSYESPCFLHTLHKRSIYTKSPILKMNVTAAPCYASVRLSARRTKRKQRNSSTPRMKAVADC